MNISIVNDIEPLSEFRKKSADFVKRLKEQKRPIVLTQHGKSAAVLVEAGEYQRLVDKMALMERLLEAEQQIAEGKVISHDEAKQRILQNLEKWK